MWGFFCTPSADGPGINSLGSGPCRHELHVEGCCLFLQSLRLGFANCSRHQKWNSTALLHGACGSDKNRNGTTLFFNDITAFNVLNYLILNNIMALWLRNA
jgi:hypothetical protein